MKTQFSAYLEHTEPALRRLIARLRNEYAYVSVLATDSGGTSYRVGRMNTGVNDYWLQERGCVVRVYRDGLYSEYSFDRLADDVEKQAEAIIAELNEQLAMQKELGLEQYDTVMLKEEEATLLAEKEVGILPEDVSAEDVVKRLKRISDTGIAMDERVLECAAAVSMVHVNKMFLSEKRCLKQSYVFSEGSIGVLVRDGEKTQMDYKGFSGLKGAELFDDMEAYVEPVVNDALELLKADRVEPGEYDIITTPEVSGLIAHEAFGHGVEMDMFVKERALAKAYIGKRVASNLVEMHEGALVAEDTSSYAFDDEGVLANDVTEIKGGILQTGICDTISALRLGIKPTGNGKRQSFERKAYTRMTNTVFMGGKDSLDDMIASIDHGYLLDGVQSGMEDPKHWGIQCMLTKGREIKDGKLTGKIVSPVIMTGYVPDLLQSISMVSPDVSVSGTGYCGKGHKEFVKAADGGPYLKAKGRLG